MLVSFSVENFRSFGGEQTLNLVSSRAQKGHEDHCIPIGDSGESVLRTSVIYGANAAGKSNLVRAMDFARDLIIDGAGPLKRIALNQFRFDSRDDSHPSTFDFRFYAHGRLFSYGFDITRDAVKSEWLSVFNDASKEIDIFHREGKEIKFGDLSKFGDDAQASIEALEALKLLGTRPNQLLLNKIVDLDGDRRGALLNIVVWWFNECLTIIEPGASYRPMIELLDEKSAFREFAGEFLANVGTGIGDIDVEQNVIDADNLPKPLLENLQSANAVEVTKMAIGPGMSLHIDPDDPTKVIRRNLTSHHQVGDARFHLPFDEESDGTQRLLHLLPALYHLKNSCKVFVIDELDRSLHPILSHALLKFFSEACPGSCQQMIVTSHETHLLDLDLLRRDEIWFAEKDASQQTQLYPLTDMRVRNDLRIEKGYLQGRFGGIPFIGGMDRLRDLVDCGESTDA